MIWHVLTIVFGALTVLSGICPAPCSDVMLGILVVIFGVFALDSFRKQQRKEAER